MKKLFTLACILVGLQVTLQVSSGQFYKISDFTGGYFKIVSKEQGKIASQKNLILFQKANRNLS
jgi:hypothetical protein